MPEIFQKKFSDFVQKHGLIKQNDLPCLLAVSGGLDSTVLAHLFFLEKIPFAIAHINFGLRGAESDGDELFVKNLAAELGADFYTILYDTKKEAKKLGISTQLAARNLRLDWLEKTRSENNYSAIGLAHHLSDQLETVLFNLSRGSGLAGFRGMLPRRDHFIRPLLFATRTEILEFAKAKNLTWREDSSNATDDYSRNFIRHHLVPEFEKLNPDFLHTAARSIERLRQTEQNHDYFLEKTLREMGRHDQPTDTFFLKKTDLKKLPAPEELLNFWLKPNGFDTEQCRQIFENLEKQPGQIWENENWQVTLDRSEIILSPKKTGPAPTLLQADDLMTSLPDGSKIFIFQSTPPADFLEEKTTIYVPAEKLHWPLTVRLWQPGDHFHPFGMGGQTKKVKDFLTDLKVPRPEKKRQLVLANGDGQIIWVIGRRADERFRVGENDAKILKISFRLP